MLNTPVLFLIFNRPELTEKVFAQIKKSEPKQLFIAADGPRLNKSGEYELCEKTRNLVLNNINWPCEVKTLLRNNNLGCKMAVSSAITWFFEDVEQGIILEDDCLPDLSFFSFCEELLIKYKNVEKISMISGCNFNDEKKNYTESSYSFSKYFHIWGWATWRRVWKNYDVTIKDFPEFFLNNQIKHWFSTESERNYWLSCFIKVFNNGFNTWDYQFFYSMWKSGGISIIPIHNLISNIGFDNQATHTKVDNSRMSNLATKPVKEIKHPDKIQLNVNADKYILKNFIFKKDNIGLKLKKQLKKTAVPFFNFYKHSTLFFKRHPIISKKDYKKLISLPRYVPSTITLFNRPFLVPDASSFLAGLNEIFINKNYLFKSNKENPYIIDCGANIGLSILFFKNLYPKSKILAFEADKKLAKILQQNINSFGFNNITVMSKAVWIEDENISFISEGGFSGRISSTSNETEKVEAIRLLNYIDKEVDFLKMDIEGAEVLVLKDCVSKLSMVKLLFVEYHSKFEESQQLPDLLETLSRAGFRYQIKESYNSKYPFVERSTMMDMEFQADIFAYR